ncbi:hypothetical protein, partial [Yimella sp. RIT 621]|uniref:hypothetical protein n=1 Tax=Yimella sp. RIT 621 TaxID=2510323 RepID=UPI00197A760B
RTGGEGIGGDRVNESFSGWTKTLAVVTRALSDPQVVEYTARDALTAAKPYVFRTRMPDVR